MTSLGRKEGASLLAVGLPGNVTPLLLGALGRHPALTPRDEDIVAVLRALADDTEALVSNGPSGAEAPPPALPLVAASVRAARPGRRVWVTARAAAAGAVAAALGARVLRWLPDGRLGARVASGVADPVGAAARLGRTWAEERRAALAIAGAVDLDPQRPQAALAALGLPPDPVVVASLGLLQTLKPPALPPRLEAAFRAWPAAHAALPPPAQRLPSLSRHPAVLLQRAEHALQQGDPRAARDLVAAALPASPRAGTRAALLHTLAAAGAVEEAVMQAERWRADEDAPAAWVVALDQPDHPVAFALVGRARRHPHAAVRSAAARWLVHHGLDWEAAEVACRVRGLPWRAAPYSVASS